MNRRTRGAATVSVLWVIVLVVLVLGLGAFLYMLADDRTRAQEEHQQAVQAKEALDKQFQASRESLVALSKSVGFREETDPNSLSTPDKVQARIKQIQEGYSSFVGADASNTALVIDRLQTHVDELTRLLDEARTQARTAEQARESLQASSTDMQRQRDEAYADLQKQVQTERDRNGQQEQADKARIEELTRRLADQESRAKGEKDALETTVKTLTEDLHVREGRISELAKKVEIIKLPDEPDGSVVAVSTANTCYLDIGSKQLLRRGTRFKVFSYGKGGAMHEKGMIEVTRVRDEESEATIIELKDRFDPIARGDQIAAPNYDPQMPREFVLVGRFPSGYSRAMVADRLRQLGATVKDTVGPTTDFLVMGDKDDTGVPAGEGTEGGDASGGAGAEDAEQKRAQLYRVQQVPVREILEYLKYE